MNTYLIKHCRLSLIGAVTLLLSLVSSVMAQEHPQRWSKSIQGERGTPKDERRCFDLGTVTQGETRLVGQFFLEEHVMEGQKGGAFVIEGSQADDGTFWPNVELQVSNEVNGKWQTIVSLLNNSALAHVTVYPGLTIYGLNVNFDSLKPLIGKYKFGRVLLKTGEKSIFDLDDLKP